MDKPSASDAHSPKATANIGCMATTLHGRPRFKWQRLSPGRIPSSTEPPSIGSSGVRIETQREGALAEIELPL
jgi:hypothetical protein